MRGKQTGKHVSRYMATRYASITIPNDTYEVDAHRVEYEWQLAQAVTRDVLSHADSEGHPIISIEVQRCQWEPRDYEGWRGTVYAIIRYDSRYGHWK